MRVGLDVHCPAVRCCIFGEEQGVGQMLGMRYEGMRAIRKPFTKLVGSTNDLS